MNHRLRVKAKETIQAGLRRGAAKCENKFVKQLEFEKLEDVLTDGHVGTQQIDNLRF